MDVEKTMQFILDQQAHIEAIQAKTTEHLAEHIVEHDRRMAEFEKGLNRLDARLDRAVRLGIREARHERQRRQEMDARFDEQITKLAAAQLVTEEKLQVFIDSMRRGGNGHS